MDICAMVDACKNTSSIWEEGLIHLIEFPHEKINKYWV